MKKREIKIGARIICKDNKEWGTWVILNKYDQDIYEIKGNSGITCRETGELLKFWELA